MTGTRGRRTPHTTASIAACAVIAAAAAGCGSDWEVDPATESVLSSTAILPEVTATSTVSASSVNDASDLANLMAIATHVFTGRVESGVGSIALGAIPETQYRVRTGVSIKGSVPEEVVVNQQGGITDRVYISVNGDSPLAVGQWYLFATRFFEAQNWYSLLTGFGHQPVTEQQARHPASPPLAAAAAALRTHPHGRTQRPDTETPSLTFPTHPPPPSPPPR